MKKEYEQKLKKARAYSKFMKNLNSYCELSREDPSKWIDSFGGQWVNFHDFIYASFLFIATPGGYKYWSEIAES